jgi:hypothetical protein
VALAVREEMREEMRQSRLNVMRREAETHFVQANMLMQEADELQNNGPQHLQGQALLTNPALAGQAPQAPQHSQLALCPQSERQIVQQVLDTGSHSMRTGMNLLSFSSWSAGIAQVQAGIDNDNPRVYGMVPLAQLQPQSKVLVMVYIDKDVPDFKEAEFRKQLAKQLNAKERLAEITRDQIRVARKARAGADRSKWKASLQRGQCYVKVEVDEEDLFDKDRTCMPSYTSSSDASSDCDVSSSDMEDEEEQAETEVKEALRWVFGSSLFPAENVEPELCYGPIQANSLWLAIRLPAPLALLLLEAARQRSPELLDERVRCMRLIRNEMIRDQQEVKARLDDRPDIEECLATLEREEATVLAKVEQQPESSTMLKQVSSDDDFDPEIRCVLFATNHYDALGIERDATLRQIQAAYRKKARRVHPDGKLRMSAEAMRKQLQNEEERLIEERQPEKRWPEDYTLDELKKQAETRGIKRKGV